LNVARRVRTLKLWPNAVVDAKPVKGVSIRAAVAKRIRQYKAAKVTAAMLQVIRSMSNVTEFALNSNLYCHEHSDIVRVLPVISAGWTGFGATLWSLTLHVSIEGFCHVSTPSMVFPSLEELAIKFDKAYFRTDSTKIVREYLTPFVSNHYATLQSFCLSSGDH
jgi:hypothetical protein